MLFGRISLLSILRYHWHTIDSSKFYWCISKRDSLFCPEREDFPQRDQEFLQEAQLKPSWWIKTKVLLWSVFDLSHGTYSCLPFHMDCSPLCRWWYSPHPLKKSLHFSQAQQIMFDRKFLCPLNTFKRCLKQLDFRFPLQSLLICPLVGCNIPVFGAPAEKGKDRTGV